MAFIGLIPHGKVVGIGRPPSSKSLLRRKRPSDSFTGTGWDFCCMSIIRLALFLDDLAKPSERGIGAPGCSDTN